ncbi:MAG TPA: alkaline phosphatase family protein [Verrucomicrobiae bacterium]
MKALLPLFVFIDACGWEIVKREPFLSKAAPNRRRLTSVFGYSSACVPSILSGRWPAEHRNWNYFVYDPEHSPFRSLRPLRWLPSAVTGRRIFRRSLSRLVKSRLSFRGYFDLYNIPFKHISLYNFSETKSPLQPGGLNRGPNIFDYLEERAVPYFVSDPGRDEFTNHSGLLAEVQSERIDFAFQYWPGLDGMLHFLGNRSPEIPVKLRVYEDWIGQLLAAARAHYEEVRLYVFSDHGMANCDTLLDLQREIAALPLRVPDDYAVVYDSTMARFWFFNDRARWLVTRRLQEIKQGRIVPDEELEKLGAFFPDRYFGELIFLAQEGVLIVPSHMGARPIRGMHGYHPDDIHSYAALCTNQDNIPGDIDSIPHMFRLMTRDADLAKARNTRQFSAAPAFHTVK